MVPARCGVAGAVLGAAAAVVLGPALLAPEPAAAATGTGPGGQRLTVPKATGLAPAGETVTVSGAGYDATKGIYVALCVDNGAGQPPSPCGGGIDTTGGSGASYWISSNPPAYGKGLAIPYGPGGTFRVELKVAAALAAGVDCRSARCAVVTRADHTRTGDRSQDVRVPVAFAAAGAPAPTRTTAAAAPAAGGGTTTTAAADAAASSAGAPVAGALPPAGSAGPAAPGDLSLTRTSASQSANRWWAGITAALVLGLATFAVRAVVRRRRARAVTS
ncbi:hypothetical protein KZZ52_35005 [Dactylosporangium sp. AC04546]|uniref:hypothetical protein n=1 Tax=Dactylosporangium sp. AC04546 TaxID=2862460 RepID=UPI002E7ACD43|nr:hypothetical protein [Dactylosporangium sp. AC04546]WVK79180.1 hypothetical protein KZZ52_35005 [Dactylosporangium sp. AC04546]